MCAEILWISFRLTKIGKIKNEKSKSSTPILCFAFYHSKSRMPFVKSHGVIVEESANKLYFIDTIISIFCLNSDI